MHSSHVTNKDACLWYETSQQNVAKRWDILATYSQLTVTIQTTTIWQDPRQVASTSNMVHQWQHTRQVISTCNTVHHWSTQHKQFTSLLIHDGHSPKVFTCAVTLKLTAPQLMSYEIKHIYIETHAQTSSMVLLQVKHAMVVSIF